MFVDNVNIFIKAGNGGSGLASFLRAKYIPFGGPDGGDGGKGGDVIFMASHDVPDLGIFRQKTQFNAENGITGGPQKRTGQNGNNLVIEVPVGTLVYVSQDEGNALIADLKKDRQKITAANGGRGGMGNVHFATATRKAPKEFQAGQEGKACSVNLKLALLIDVAIVGLPNSGKSTLLASVSEAKPEIAGYPFTTRVPVLGIVDSGKNKCTWAEIPSISEKSRGNKSHVPASVNQLQRASVIMYLADANSESIEQELEKLINEIESPDINLKNKRYVVAINKTDLIENREGIEKIKHRLEGKDIPVFLISAIEKKGLDELVSGVNSLVAEAAQKEESAVKPEKVFRPKPR